MGCVKHILVAIDLGDASKQALDYARTLAGSFEASLHLLCVVQDPFSLPWAPEASRDALSTLLAQMQRDAQAHLETMIMPADRQRRGTRLVTRVGKPSDQILTYVRENTIDLIVMGREVSRDCSRRRRSVLSPKPSCATRSARPWSCRRPDTLENGVVCSRPFLTPSARSTWREILASSRDAGPMQR
jgi:nucleotide-binding universal stress UspA family protein